MLVDCDEAVWSLGGSLGSSEGDIGAFDLGSRFDFEGTADCVDDEAVEDDETGGIPPARFAVSGRLFRAAAGDRSSIDPFWATSGMSSLLVPSPAFLMAGEKLLRDMIDFSHRS